MKGLRSKSAKRYIALLLSFVMMAMTALTSVAEEPKKPDWQLNEKDVWVNANDNNAEAKNAWIDKDGASYFAGEDGKTVKNTWIPGVDGSSWYYVGGDGRMLSGETITIKGKSYKFDGSGALEDPKEPAKDSEIYVLGWVKSGEGEFYYFGKTGKKAVGWHEIDEEWYYFEYDGKMFAGDQMTIDGVTYTFSDSGALTNPSEPKLKEGWVQERKDFYYYENGDMVIDDWREGVSAANGNTYWYYLGPDGRSGWKSVGGGRYHFDDEGVMSAKTWVNDEGGERYVDANGEIVRDAVVPRDSSKAYVNKDGYFDATVNGEKAVGALTYTFKNGIVDDTKAPEFATPSDATKAEDLLNTLEQLNELDDTNSLELRTKVADALVDVVKKQASTLTADEINQMDEALAKAYGLDIDNLVTATSADADLVVYATGLVLASGYKSTDTSLMLEVEEATPATATKVVLDVKLLVNGEEIKGDLVTPVSLTVKTPEAFADAYDRSQYKYTVEHIHGGKKTTLADVVWTPSRGGALRVDFKTKSFSEFVLTATKISSSGGSYSRSVASTTPTGKWVRAADGVRWWYQNPDGTWPANGWAQLVWNGKTDWYYFDAEGYMVTGWVTWENNRYYLHPVSDGTQGYMYTGWHEIDGKWYYFRPESGGPQGSLFVNGTTPDGYNVDANGVWIQ